MYYNNFYEMQVLGVMQGVMVVGITIAILMMLGFFVFEAIGLYQISKKRGYQKPWLAFIPIVSSWVLGGIADNINFCYGKRTRHRVLLLAVEAVWALLYICYMVVFLLTFQQIMVNAIMNGSSFDPQILTFYSMGSLVSLLSLGRLVVRCLALHKLYQDYDKKNTVLFLVLSVLLNLGCFFLFACRNKPSASLYWSYCQQHPEAAPYGNPPFGGSPGGGTVYGGQPYGGSPNPPYGNPPRTVTTPYAGAPSSPPGTQPYGAAPNGNAPYGNPPYSGTSVPGAHSAPVYGNPPAGGTAPMKPTPPENPTGNTPPDSPDNTPS